MGEGGLQRSRWPPWATGLACCRSSRSALLDPKQWTCEPQFWFVSSPTLNVFLSLFLSASYKQKGSSMVVHSFMNSMDPPGSAEMSQMANRRWGSTGAPWHKETPYTTHLVWLCFNQANLDCHPFSYLCCVACTAGRSWSPVWAGPSRPV